MSRNKINLFLGCAFLALSPFALADSAGAQQAPRQAELPRVLLPQKQHIPVPESGRDNLGNHQATTILQMNGFTISGIPVPGRDTEAANKWYVDQIAARILPPDNLGNHIATRNIDMRGRKVINLGDANLLMDGDGVNVKTLRTYVAANGDNLGNHQATKALVLNRFPILTGEITGTDQTTGEPIVTGGMTIGDTTIAGLTLPVSGDHAANKDYVDQRVASIVGDNLGDHVANRSLSMSSFKITDLADATITTDTDAVNVRTMKNYVTSMTRPYTGANGVAINATTRVVSADATVVRTSGAQIIDGLKTFRRAVIVSTDANEGVIMRNAAGVVKANLQPFAGDNSTRLHSYNAGTLTASLGLMADGVIKPITGRFDGNNRRITMVADPLGPQDAVNLRTMQAAIVRGVGDHLGNHIALRNLDMKTFKVVHMGDANINVDGDGVNVKTLKAYVAANGDNLGNHTATQIINAGGFKVTQVADPTDPQDAVNLRTLETRLVDADIEHPVVISQRYAVRPTAAGSHSFSVGNGAVAKTDFSIAAGPGAQANAPSAIALGDGTQVADKGAGSVAVGQGASVLNKNSVAIGIKAKSDTEYGIAIGEEASVGQWSAKGIAIGRYSSSTQLAGMALGSLAESTAPGSVALGWSSRADVDNTISVGHDTFKRRIMHVGDPVDPTDAVNLRTLQAVAGDNLGDHVATRVLNMNAQKIESLGAADLNNPMDAVNVRTMRLYVAANVPLMLDYTGADGVSIDANHRVTADATVVRTSGNQTISGVKTFGRVVISDPVNPTDAVNLRTMQTYTAANHLALRTNGASQTVDLRLYSGGVPTATAGTLTIQGSLTVTQTMRAQNYVTTSDLRLKEKVEPIATDAGIEIVRALRPVTYDLRSDGSHAAGLIAQEVRGIMPYAVSENEKGDLGVEYTQMIAPMIAAIQALDDRDDKLEARIEQLETALGDAR